ncbi:hypothetical protein N9937_00920 [bacterium]|nr:hypothetical protein [bacterium]
MAKEIERKFRIEPPCDELNTLIKHSPDYALINQGYLSGAGDVSVFAEGFLVVDFPTEVYEFKIPQTDAVDILMELSAEDLQKLRVRTYGSKGFLTIKRKGDRVAENDEFEFEILFEDAKELLDLCKYTLQKLRYIVMNNEDRWEVDLFCGALTGLVLAEFEHEEYDTVMNVEIPSWIGYEVTDDKGFSNFALAKASSED